jgi:hypothetical protein
MPRAHICRRRCACRGRSMYRRRLAKDSGGAQCRCDVQVGRKCATKAAASSRTPARKHSVGGALRLEWRGACVAVSEPEKRPATFQRDHHRSHPCPHLVTVIVHPTRLPPRTRIHRRVRAWESTKALASVHMSERTDARAQCSADTHAPTRMGTRARNTNRGEPHAGQRRGDRATLPRAMREAFPSAGNGPAWRCCAAVHRCGSRPPPAHPSAVSLRTSARIWPRAVHGARRTHAMHTHQALPAPMGAGRGPIRH